MTDNRVTSNGASGLELILTIHPSKPAVGTSGKSPKVRKGPPNHTDAPSIRIRQVPAPR